MTNGPGTQTAEAHIREVFRRLFDERDLSDPSAFWSDSSSDEFLAAGTVRGVDVIRLDADGRIDTNTIYYDGAEFARQVGLLPRRDSLPDRWMMSMFNNATKLRRAIKQ